MEQKDKITKPNWALIEAIAFRVYPNEASVLTRDDIEEIEEGLRITFSDGFVYEIRY